MDELNQIAMQIILHAGDARTSAMKAMDLISESNFEEAYKLLKEAKREIVEAHRIHTKKLQEAIADEENVYTILFAHAQDTLMAINTEINLIEKTYQMMVTLNKRLENLENK